MPAGGSAVQPAAEQRLAGGLAQRQRRVAGPGRAAQQHDRLAHLAAVEEPLAAAQHVGDAGLGQRLLERLGLAR